MIQEAKKRLEDVLRHNDTISRTEERDKNIQRQEEDWREKEKIQLSQEEAE